MTKPEWDKARPEKPDRDPLLDDIVDLLENDPRSNWALANVSGLSTATLKNWKARQVRRPQSVSLQMAARALGKKLAFVDDKPSRKK